jgi:N4-gp56 family major capsid protein
VTRNEIQQGNQVIYSPQKKADGTAAEVLSRYALDGTCKMTSELVAKAATQLKKMNAPTFDGKYVCILHPSVAFDLRQDEAWIAAHQYAAATELFSGEIGELHGVRFVETSEAKIWKGTGCPTGLAVFSTLILGAHAYGSTEIEGGGLEHIVKQLGYGDDPLNQRASVGWKGMRAAERLVEQYMVRIESASSYSATAAAN